MVGKTKFPAVTDPHGAARDVTVAVQNIRARLEAIEGSMATSAQLNASVASLQASAAAPATPGSTPITFVASVAILPGQAVCEVSPGVIALADASQQADSFSLIGIATSGGGPGANISVTLYGSIATVSGSGFTPGVPVYVQTAGAIAQTPYPGFPALQVGVAVSASMLLVLPDQQLTTWQVNGVTVGVRRQVNFVGGGGLVLSGVDDPSNNRVIISIGQTFVTLPGNQIEDAFPWDYDEPEEDTWFIGYDDTAQGNNSVVFPWYVSYDDPWDWSYDEVWDEWAWAIAEFTRISVAPPIVLDDAWDFGYEEVEDDSWWAIAEFAPLNVVLPSNSLEDVYPWEEEESDESWWLQHDEGQTTKYRSPNPAEDAFAQDEEWREELWWPWYDDRPVVSSAPPRPVDEGWIWDEPDQQDETWWDQP